jgi:type I restriction enzyme S subunit
MSSEELDGRYSIGDLIRVGAISAHKDGNFGSLYPRIDDFVDDGFPLLTAKVVTAGRICFDAAQKLSKEKAASLPYGFIQAGDVLLSHNATVGRVAVVPEFSGQALIGTSLTYFRLDKSRLLPRYLACFFESRDFQNQLASVMGLSTRNQVPITAQRTLEVEVPILAIQRQISDFVGALDDRITLLRETNATLVAIAHALFNSWFVDFDPVRAKMEGRAPEGMDEATAALFPDGYEESELGLVPKGWHVGSIGDHTSYLNRGISPKYIEDGGIVVINQKCIRDFSLDISKARRHDPAQRKIDGRELLKGDVLVNSTGVGTLGRVAQVLSLECPAIVDSHVTVMRAGPAVTWNYLGLSIMRRQPEIENMGEGSTGQTELSRGKLAALKLLVPSAGVLQEFDSVVLPLRKRFSANQTQSQTLATLRDTLLPRLISGQLLLPEAMQEMENALL